MKTSEKAEVWRRHVEAYRLSGLTRAEYCKQHQIRVGNLDYWRKRLNSVDKGDMNQGAANWLPVRVHDALLHDNGGQINVRIGRMVVEIQSGFSPRLLAEVLRVIGPLC